MKRIILLLTNLVLLLVSVPGCEETSNFPIEQDQEIIFHYSYENYAWGYQFYGWYIDKEGVIRDLEEPLLWNEEITAILDENIAIYWHGRDSLDNQYAEVSGKVLGRIRPAEMEAEIDRIGDISNLAYTTPENTMADAGIVIYGFLSLDKYTNRYRRVVLRLTGDWSSSLDDPEAESLAGWLMKIQENIGYPDYKE